jgi:hypothetical protein
MKKKKVQVVKRVKVMSFNEATANALDVCNIWLMRSTAYELLSKYIIGH